MKKRFAIAFLVGMLGVMPALNAGCGCGKGHEHDSSCYTDQARPVDASVTR